MGIIPVGCFIPRFATAGGSVIRILLTALLGMVLTSAAPADEKLKDIACRSIHLGYTADAGTAFYTEATVRTSAPGTYFCTCGFNAGYFGIQELANGKKLVIFSVWDPTTGDDPKTVPEEKRVQTLHKGDGVRVGRFGGEGTGGQSFFDFDWKVGDTYRFIVSATADGKDRTAYSGYFYLPETKEWKHLVTFSTLAKQKQLSGYYSFIEDFKRNKVSATQVRQAEFGNGWVRNGKGEWNPILEARFTGDSNPVLNIDAGLTKSKDRFYLVTGGDTENTTTNLKDKLTQPKDAKLVAPKDFPELFEPKQ